MGLRLEQENADSDGYSFLALKAGEFVFTTSELFSEDSETLYPSHKQVYYGQVFLMQVDRPSKDADTAERSAVAHMWQASRCSSALDPR